eukprot:TRINITY_DN1152_c1_g1_i2.p1 TRINITY_DN1152_c1_g1~~TRINITY_DN1152_c1_g1_i2.p1  ORF type:complete len:248 (+),score=-27.35 TRINITY_DN1152_c1_g1_i2:219-962(+)
MKIVIPNSNKIALTYLTIYFMNQHTHKTSFKLNQQLQQKQAHSQYTHITHTHAHTHNTRNNVHINHYYYQHFYLYEQDQFASIAQPIKYNSATYNLEIYVYIYYIKYTTQFAAFCQYSRQKHIYQAIQNNTKTIPKKNQGIDAINNNLQRVTNATTTLQFSTPTFVSSIFVGIHIFTQNGFFSTIFLRCSNSYSTCNQPLTFVTADLRFYQSFTYTKYMYIHYSYTQIQKQKQYLLHNYYFYMLCII